MAQVYVTGPVDLWVLTSTYGGQPRFLGHGERAPTINLIPFYVTHQADVAGAAVFERFYNGMSARISVDLIRFNQATLDEVRLASASGDWLKGPEEISYGFDPPGSIGTATKAERVSHILYLRFPAANRPGMNGQANPRARLPAGYRFFYCTLDPQVIRGGSTVAHKVSLTWQATPWFIPEYRNGWGYGAMVLFDKDMSALDGLRPD